MSTIKRPLNRDAVEAADEEIYAAHENDDRPNALFDKDGNRLKLDPTDPDQKTLCDDWKELYRKHKGEIENPDDPPDDPPDVPVQPCPKQDELILVEFREQRGVGTEIFHPATSVRKQWVNLQIRMTDDFEPIFDRGQAIGVIARVAWKSGKQSDLAGHSVRFDVEPEPGNRQGLIPEIQHQRDPVMSQTDEEGWTRNESLNLSLYGGDKFSLRATLATSPDQTRQIGEYTVWRRVHYEVETMRRRNGKQRRDQMNEDGLNEKMKPHFVDLVRVGEDSHPPYKRIISAEDFPPYVKELKHPNPSEEKPLLRYVFCDLVVGHKRPLRKTRWVPKSREITIFNRFIGISEKNGIDDAQWKHAGGAWASFPKQNLSLIPNDASDDDRYRIRVALEGVPGLDQKRRVKLKLRLIVEGGIGGFTQLDSIAITTHRAFSGALHKRFILYTCFHEAGHAMNIAAPETPDGLTNPFYDHDHPKHCKFGKRRCRMHAIAVLPTKFCPTCSDCLRGHDLSVLPIEEDKPE